MILGSISRSGAVPTFLRTPTMMQPHLDLKPFLQFPMETQPSMGLFHNFSTMDPVQKAVMNHTFGAPLIRTKRAVISCNVCQIRFNSENQAEAHYKGNRHARRVRGIETSKSRPRENDKPLLLPAPAPPSTPSPTSNLDESEASRADDQPLPQMKVSTPAPPPVPVAPPPVPESPMLLPPCSLLPLPVPGGALISSLPSQGGSAGARTPRADPAGVPNGSPLTPTPESEEDKAKKLLYCSLCKVAVNSLSQLEAHNKGTKHKTILEARSGLGPIKAYPRLGPRLAPEQGGSPADPSTQERTFHCEICNVRVNSEGQLKQHISSRRHRDGVAGKPNTLLNRGKKQRTGDLTSTLSFSKDLPKSLGAGLLPSPLVIAAAMAAATSSSPLALRAAVAGHAHHPSHHHHHHLLQGPPLSHTLLRPAPGPIRTAHGPIIFSPY
ncbi:zinc finger protein 385A [Acipenser ruthenus]|uniref:zinc finger protein 385A n=1 Tax=Acipenser ruthenus TaxID=7906 RepID=UPI0027411E19|nr:zinc finger protein 385A [Acipenser ruthenus]